MDKNQIKLLENYKKSYAERLDMLPAQNPPKNFSCDNPFSEINDLPVASIKTQAISGFSKEKMYETLEKQGKLHKMIGSNVDDIDKYTLEMFNDYLDFDELPNSSLINKPVEKPNATTSQSESGEASPQELNNPSKI